MSTKYTFILSLVIFSSFLLKAQIHIDTLPVDTNNVKYKLWKAIETDTLPYHISHENIEKLAISSTIRLMAVSGFDSTINPTAEDIKTSYAKAYYDNLLAQHDSLLDFFELNLEEQYPEILRDLNGHLGLRRYLSCYNNPSDSCAAIIKWGVSFMRKAADSSSIMPKEQWEWLANSIERKLPYDNFNDRIQILSPTPTVLDGKDWEGAILSFSRAPGKKNLLLSNGSRFPIKVLEWSDSTATWEDSTVVSGLENYPGGYRLYTADINADGYEDLIVLRSASSRMSPSRLFPSILKNNGDGTYKDISLELGLQQIYKPQCACVGDINQDGLADIFFGNLRDQSILLVQNPDGTFTDKRNVYGMNEFRDNVQDCAFTDINGDGKQDLILSLNRGINKVYIQDLTTDKNYVYYDNRTKQYQLETPFYGGAILTGATSQDNEGILFLSDVSERYDILPYILSKKDTITKDTSYYLAAQNNKLSKILLPKELALYRAGVWVQTFEGMRLLYAGGKTTESILPYFEYNLNENKVRIAQNDDFPIYVHSVTVIEQNSQPVFLFKGGADYPIMKSTIRQIDYRPDTSGSYHRIFDIQNAKISSTIKFKIVDNQGEVYERNLIVQARDSKGNHAMQEWIWLPAGYTIIHDTPKVIAPENNKKGKKKSKKK